MPDQQIELIVTASVGLVWSGQYLEHNAQRQKPLRALLLTLLLPPSGNHPVVTTVSFHRTSADPWD